MDLMKSNEILSKCIKFYIKGEDVLSRGVKGKTIGAIAQGTERYLDQQELHTYSSAIT